MPDLYSGEYQSYSITSPLKSAKPNTKTNGDRAPKRHKSSFIVDMKNVLFEKKKYEKKNIFRQTNLPATVRFIRP